VAPAPPLEKAAAAPAAAALYRSVAAAPARSALASVSEKSAADDAADADPPAKVTRFGGCEARRASWRAAWVSARSAAWTWALRCCEMEASSPRMISPSTRMSARGGWGWWGVRG
jgi:hypothetical protein